MKKLFLLSMCLLGLYGSLFPQAPTETPIGSPAAATAATAATAAAPIAAPGSTPTAAPTATASTVSSDLADRIHRKLEKKLGRKHGIIIDGNDKDKDEDEDLQKMRDFIAIPIVAIVFLSIFGAPVAIVVMIGIFSIIATRMRQRTIRMMVEKGQPVPAELLAPEVRHVRRRSDVRRGVVWSMVGLGMMIFFGAVNDWEGGVWSLGLIPFLIGLGYLLIWKLDKKDIPPPPPAP